MVPVVPFLKGYRTFVVNLVIALVGVLVALGVIPAAEAVTAEQVDTAVNTLIGGVAVIVAVVNFLLRIVTNTKPGAAE